MPELFNFYDTPALLETGDLAGFFVGDISAAAISPDTPKLLFSRKEAAYSLGLSLRSIAILLKNGELGYRRCGTKVLIPHQELVRFSKRDHNLD